MNETQRMVVEAEVRKVRAENEELRRERDAVRDENVALRVQVNRMVADREYVVC